MNTALHLMIYWYHLFRRTYSHLERRYRKVSVSKTALELLTCQFETNAKNWTNYKAIPSPPPHNHLLVIPKRDALQNGWSRSNGPISRYRLRRWITTNRSSQDRVAETDIENKRWYLELRTSRITSKTDEREIPTWLVKQTRSGGGGGGGHPSSGLRWQWSVTGEESTTLRNISAHQQPQRLWFTV